MQALVRGRRHRAGRLRPGGGRTEADRGAGRRDPRDHRAQDDPRAVLRRPRHPPGQPRPVPRRPATRSCRCSRCDPIYVNFGVPQQEAGQLRVGRRVRLTCRRASRTSSSTGRVTAIDSVVDATTRNVQVQATFANPNGKLRPGMFVQAEVAAGATAVDRSRCRRRRSATRRTATRSSSSTDMKDPDGQTVPRRAAAVREAWRRRAAIRSRCFGRQGRRRSRDVGRVQAAQRRRGAGQQQGASPPNNRGAEARGQLNEVH